MGNEERDADLRYLLKRVAEVREERMEILEQQLATAEAEAAELRERLDGANRVALAYLERDKMLREQLAQVTALVGEADLMKRMCGYAISANMAGLLHANHNTAIITQDTKALHTLRCAIRNWRERQERSQDDE